MDATIASALLDRQEVVDVAVRYATALDTRDWDLLRTCFLSDATAVYEGLGECDGYAAIEDVCRTALTPLDASQHLVSNFAVTIDGDHATHSCYLQAQHVRRGAPGGPNFIMAGRYSDDLVRTEAGWRVRRREFSVLWTDGNPSVMVADPAAG